jgi:hypothetical protein
MKLVKPDLMNIAWLCRNLRDADRREAFACRFDPNPDKLAVWAYETWGAFSFMVLDNDNVPAAFIGATELWPGVSSAWMLTTDRFDSVGVALTRWVRRVMIPAIVEGGCRRLEANSIEGHDVAHRWLEHLGAVREGTKAGYGKNGEDFHIYKWSF